MESLQVVKDTEMKSRIIGMSTQMETFQYFFGITLGELIFNTLIISVELYKRVVFLQPKDKKLLA